MSALIREKIMKITRRQLWSLIRESIERELSDDEVSSFSRMTYDNAWKHYVPGYFAGNVPHGIVMLSDGIIPPSYLNI